nr:MAG TPA: hypothetical protein [Caudoviricetes sp.]
MIQLALHPRLALTIHVYYLYLLHLYMTISLYF